MKLCCKCNSRMVEVKLVNLIGRTYKALVCTYCGHIYTKDWFLKREWKVG